MKLLICHLIIFSMGMILVLAQAPLTVEVENIPNDKGELRIGLFDNEETFLVKPFQGKITPVTQAGKMAVVFEDIPAGTYALSIIHDENANGELDKNFVGIPKESYGFSQNPGFSMGPPKFEKTTFEITDQPLKIVVRMK